MSNFCWYESVLPILYRGMKEVCDSVLLGIELVGEDHREGSIHQTPPWQHQLPRNPPYCRNHTTATLPLHCTDRLWQTPLSRVQLQDYLGEPWRVTFYWKMCIARDFLECWLHHVFRFSFKRVWISSRDSLFVQWNLSNAVTYGPDIVGLIREVAAIQMTSIKRS